ncbi:unnamed protein product [Enterobius vermicularis]|uniref:dTDP-D-glucose 4,6-dehydratase n=1 Tax=Enterobius vermicularis TaxID=51028 RepID=A0A0N4VF71_ENTVE|nr:unnamed protein product [Enterobius vermicularis]
MWQPVSILVTGGCGFIGSNFVNYIFDKWPNSKLVIIDKLDKKSGGTEKNIFEHIRHSARYKFVKACLSDKQMIVDVLRTFQVDTVLHFAAITHVDQSFSERVSTINTNILGTVNLLEAISFDYNGVKRFLHVSTDEVYGDSANCDTPKNEKSLMDPTNPYSASKAACELILNAYRHSYKIPSLLVRMNNVYGPRQVCSKLIPKFILLAIEGKPYPLYGDGQHVRSWIYIDDCTEAIKRVVEDGRIGEIYNIGTDFEITNYSVTLQIHEQIQKFYQRESTSPQFKKIADRPYHDRRYYIDTRKINNELNWSCKVPFREGLQKTIKYYIEKYSNTRINTSIRG